MLGSLPVALTTAIPQSGDPFQSFDGMVIIIGVSLVLAILVLMTLIILLEGKIFSAFDKNKKGKKDAPAKKAQKAAEKPAAPVAKAAAPAPYIEQGVPPQVVAAIAAAVASMEGGKFELRSVTRAKGAQSAWNMAGTVSYTEPF